MYYFDFQYYLLERRVDFKKRILNDSIPTMYGIITENELLLLLIL